MGWQVNKVKCVKEAVRVGPVARWEGETLQRVLNIYGLDWAMKGYHGSTWMVS